MLTTKDVIAIYETLLSSPGMTDEVKIMLKLPRRNILLLTKVIELGLANKNGNETEGFFNAANGNAVDVLKDLTTDLLTKSGLSETYNKLNGLQIKQ